MDNRYRHSEFRGEGGGGPYYVFVMIIIFIADYLIMEEGGHGQRVLDDGKLPTYESV